MDSSVGAERAARPGFCSPMGQPDPPNLGGSAAGERSYFAKCYADGPWAKRAAANSLTIHRLTCPREHPLYLDFVSSSFQPPGSGEDFQKQVDAFAVGEGIREPHAPGRRDQGTWDPGWPRDIFPRCLFTGSRGGNALTATIQETEEHKLDQFGLRPLLSLLWINPPVLRLNEAASHPG